MASFLWSIGIARLGFGEYNFAEDSARNRARAKLLRTEALKMGGVIIKVGQFLSTRVDLLPDEFTEELTLLQDEVPPVPTPDIRTAVETAFALPLSEIFRTFDDRPIASASLGQAHLATLWSGQTVVVKVKRPKIDEIVRADLAALGFVVRQLNRFRVIRRRVDLPGVFREFTETLQEELDYISEAHNAERIGVAFVGHSSVLIPRVFWSHVRPGVITLERVEGIKITEYQRIEDAGISRSDLADILLRVYLQQIIVDGFFHADPHPGNVFAQPGPTVALVDFGMVGRLTERMRASLRQLFVGIVRRDFNAIVHALLHLGFIRPGADLTVIRRTVAWTLDTFYEMSFAELRDVDPRDIIDQTYDVFKAEAFQIPTTFAFLGRALGTLNGLCTGLDPDFRFASVARPYARQLIANDRTMRTVLTSISREGRDLVTATAALPRLIQDVLEGISDVEWLRTEFSNVSRGLVRVERMVRTLIIGLMATAFLVSASFLAPHYGLLALVALVVTVVLLLRVVLFMLTSRRSAI